MKVYNDTDFQNNKLKNADVEGYTKTANLATIALTGNYSDLNGKPDVPDGISMSLNTTTYEITVSLKKGSTVIATSAAIDLPLETMVVSGSYDSTNKKIILTLKNGQTIEFSVADLVSGLVATGDLASVAFSGNYNDLTNKPTLFSGDYNDLTNKPTIPDVSGKADKVTGATTGDLAGLDANGNLTDSGYSASSFLQPQTDLTTFDGTMRAGKTVVLATAVASLTVTAIENGYLESNIIFAVSGTAFTLTLPTGTKVAGTLPTFEAGGEYILSAFKGIVVCAPLTAA
jgi:hypothetical protein